MSGGIVLDCETTGFSPDDDRIIELSILPWTLEDDPDFLFNSRINPGRHISAKITDITGISEEDVRDLPRFEHHAQHICEIITAAEVVIGYKISFDKNMLSAELKRCGYEPTWPLCVDPLRVWDVYEPRESRTLTNAHKRFVDPAGFDGAHGAPADTRATRDVLRAQFTEFRLHETPWDQLDPERKSWWGPTKHVIVTDDRKIVMNFGKHDGRQIHEVDVGFWSWITKKDFPNHLLLLAMKMIEFKNKHHGEQLIEVSTRWCMEYREKLTTNEESR